MRGITKVSKLLIATVMTIGVISVVVGMGNLHDEDVVSASQLQKMDGERPGETMSAMLVAGVAPPTPTPEPTKTPTPTPAPQPPSPHPTAPPPSTPTSTPTPEIRKVEVIAPADQDGEFGDTMYYAFDVVNTGNVADTFRLELASEHGFPLANIPSEIFLRAGESITVSTYVELTFPEEILPEQLSDLPDSTALTLTAASVTEPGVKDDDSVVTLFALSKPAVKFSKTASKRVLVPGETVIYTLNYRNIGNIPLAKLVIEDQLPETVQFMESSIPVKKIERGTLRFELQPVLMQKERGRLTITARVKEDIDPNGRVINQAEFSAIGLPEPVKAQSQSTIEVPDLQITKTANQSTVGVGDILLYRITISNNGNGAAKALRILDTLPSVLSYSPGTSVLNGKKFADPRHPGARQMAWDIGNLQAGGEITLRYQATVISGAKSGRYKNSALAKARNTGGGEISVGPVKSSLTVKRRGLRALADIQALVFWDKNGNGIVDPGEPGLPDIDLILVRDQREQTSDEDGETFFADVKPGEQAVGLDERTLPEGFSLLTDSTVLLTLGERDLGYAEFGVQTNWSELTGQVYYDVNGNGQYDQEEPGIGGVSLLIDEKSAVITDQGGSIRVNDLTPGSHAIMLAENTLPEQFILTSDAFFLQQLKAQSSSTVYFSAALRPGTLTGMVFYDSNDNGTFDEGETGVPNVDILVRNGQRFQEKTDSTGRVVFHQIPPAAYTIRLLPESLESGAVPLMKLTQSINLVPGAEESLVWAIAPPIQVPQAVVDTPAPTPTPLAIEESPTPTPTPTVTPVEEEFCVYTVKTGDTLSKVAATLTGAVGNYRAIMTSNQMRSDGIKVGQELNIPKTLLLEEYQACSFEPVGSAEGRVYYDRNGNGKYDKGTDLPIPGVKVNIRSDIKTTVTDENGYYRFDNMEPGGHIVWIDPQTLPEPYRPLGDQPIIKIVVYPGGVASSAVADFIALNAQIYEEGVVEGVVCLDLNGNGNCEQDEPGIVGVTVYDPPALSVDVHQISPGTDNTPIGNCENVTFRVTIQNSASVPANPPLNANNAVNVVVTNTMPAGMTFVSKTADITTVPAGTTATQDFIYSADCDAVSGDNTTVVTFEDPTGATYSLPPANRPYTIYPGAITVTKVATAVNGTALSPPTSEPPAHLGDVVTWRIRVTSSGKGSAKNIKVIETLGAGLEFTSGPAGNTRQYDRTTHPAMADLDVNDYVDIMVDTLVSGCTDITNDVTAYWGCDDTIPGCSVLPIAKPVTAQSSVNLIVGHPLLTYNPQPITFVMNYCSTSGITEHVSLPVTNTGAVAAINAVLAVDFSPLILANVTSNPGGLVSYSGGQFVHVGTRQVGSDVFLDAGDTVTLEFDLTYPGPSGADWCAGNAGAGDNGTLIWEPTYYDQCHVKYVTPLGVNTWTVVEGSEGKPEVSVTKTCSFGPFITLTETPQTVTCTIEVSYDYPAACAADPGTSNLTVTDTYPTAWTAGNMTPVSGAPYSGYNNSTSGTVTWNIPKANLSGSGTYGYVQEFTIPAMGASICPWCGTQWTNDVQVAGQECCGCNISENASVETHVACPGPVTALSSTHTATVDTAAICTTNFTVTHVYNFTGSGWTGIPWTNNVTLTDDIANGLEYVPGSLTLSGTVCTPTATDSMSGGKLVFAFNNTAGCATVGQDNQLTITYQLRPTVNSQPQCGASYDFTDWVTLNVADISGVNTGGTAFCPGGPSGGMQEKKPVSLTARGAAMTVTLTGVEPIVGACGEYDLTLTVTKTSAEPAYDVVVRLANPNNELLLPTSTTGLTPVNGLAGTPDGNDLLWDYGDLFNGGTGQTATVTLHTQKNCVNDLELSAQLGFNNACTDAAVPPINPATRSCQVNDGPKRGIIRPPDVTITKYPEIIYASGIHGTTGYTPATWRVTVMNSGAGPAYHIEVIDTLGSDLTYLSSSWNNSTGITTYPNTTPDGSSLNGVSFVVDRLNPGEERVLTLTADIFGCQYATNDITAQVRCQLLGGGTPPAGLTCQDMSKHTEVHFPATNLVVTTDFVKKAETCANKTVTIFAKNAGLTPVSDISLFQLFPNSLQYLSGTTTYSLDGGTNWSPLADRPENGDPVPFTWAYTDGTLPTALQNALIELAPGEEIQIRFDAYVPCDFNGGNLRFRAEFDECGSVGRVSTAESLFTVIPNKPIITITKTPEEQDITCGGNAVWTIRIENAAAGTAGQPVPAQYLWLQDTWGDAYTDATVTITPQGSAPPLTSSNFHQDNANNTLTWELYDMPAGTVYEYVVTAAYGNCSGSLSNGIVGEVRCLDPNAVPDGDPLVKDSGCLIPPGITASADSIQVYPELQTTLITNTLNACDENVPIQIRLENTSSLATLYHLDADILLPVGVHLNAVPNILIDGLVPPQPPTISLVGTPPNQRQRLRFYTGDTTTPNLPDIPPGGSIIVRFNVDAQCLTSGDFSVAPQFQDCCDGSYSPGTSDLTTTWQYPQLRVEKTNDGGPYGCGETINWTITVYNDGPVAAEMVRVVDSYGAGLEPDIDNNSSLDQEFYRNTQGDTQYVWDSVARTITWEIGNLPGNGGSRSYTLLTKMGNGANCTSPADRRNQVDATWHCVTGTTANEDPTDDESTCSSGATGTHLDANVTPQVDVAATVNPSQVPLCAVGTYVDVDITVLGTSNTIYNLDPTITLPSGMAFNDTGAVTDLEISVLPGGSAVNLASGPIPADGATSLSFNNGNGVLADSVDAGTTIRIRMLVSSSCFSGGNVGVDLVYEDCCQNSYSSHEDRPITAGDPELTVAVVKTPNLDVDCNEDIQYQIAVTNTGNAISAYSIVEVSLAEWMQYQSSSNPPIFSNINPPYNAAPFNQQTSLASCYEGVFPPYPGAPAVCSACVAGFSNGTARWELKDLPPGGTWTTTLTVRPIPPAGADCDAIDRQIGVSTHYGCPDNIVAWTFNADACSNEDQEICGADGVNTYSDIDLVPDLTVTDATPTLACVNGSSSGSLVVTIQNNGDGAVTQPFTLTVTEPSLGAWSSTVTYTPSPSIPPGGTATVTIPLNGVVSCFACQTFNFAVMVDSAPGAICECNEGNNVFNPAAYTPCAAIGDYVWHDVDGDGVQDGGIETGVDNVTVNLLDQNGNSLTSMNTGATGTTGEYFFENLLPGDYAIGFDLTTLPAGYIVTSQDASGGTDSTDSDANRTTGRTITTTLTAGETDRTWDMGIYHPVSIGNYVWLDADADGTQNEAGTGIPGVTVQLLHAGTVTPVTTDADGNPMSSTQVTDGTGYYQFTNLWPGDYVVSVPQSNWTSGVFSAGQPYAGAVGSPGSGADDQNNTDDNGDNDGPAASSGVQSSSISLLSGREPTTDGDADNNSDLTVDFGFYQGLSLGDYVWYDANGDGVQDAGENGISGATVRLFLADGTTPATDIYGNTVTNQTTGATGQYQFSDLPPGDYVVEVIPPETYYFLTTGGADPDNNDNTDSNGYLSSGRFLSHPVTLTSREEPDNDGDTDSNSNLTVDFGFVRYDYGDLPDNIANYPDYPTFNASTGAYHLIDEVTYLGAGVDAESNGQANAAALGDDNNASPLADDEDGVTFVTPIMSGRPYTIEIQAGATGGGFLNAWIDFNGNGVLDDPGEHITSDQPIAAGATYTYNGVAPANLPTTVYSRFRFTSAAGQASTPTGYAPNGEVEDYALMSLGDRVWRDNGGTTGVGNNGIQDGDEAGIAGVLVELLDGSGNVITDQAGNPLTVTTDANGDYLFTGLQPGDYQVRVAASNFQSGGVLEGLFSSWPTGDAQTPNNQDVDENGINDANPAVNGICSGTTTLILGGESTSDGDTDANSDRTIDFGFIEYDYGDLPDGAYPTLLASNGARHALDGRTYLGGGVDADADGQPDVGAGSATAATGDDGDGNDDEDGVQFVTPLMAGRPYEIQVNAGPNAGVLNAWIDWNGNGTLEAGERIAADQAIAGNGSVTLTGTAPATIPTSVYTRFRFTAATGQGGDNPTGPAETGEVEDYVLMSLGDRVWRDNGDGGGTGNNGMQDGGEAGIANVLVGLLDSADNPVLDQAGNAITTTTDSNGDYLFTGLPEGQYRVRIAATNFQSGGELEGMLSSFGNGDAETPNNQDVDENGIDDANAATNGILSRVTTLTPGTESTSDGDTDANSDRTIDFGFVEYDWGDLPDTGAGTSAGNYQTLLNDDGARHALDGRTFLGAGVDVDGGGQPDIGATGDDTLDGNDDEDGVVFDTPLMPNQPYQITVTGTPGSVLNAWIDFDNNGTLETQIASNVTIPASGVLTINGTAPATVGASVYSRFRVTATTGQGGDNVSGVAQTGEVEDYALMSLGDLVWLDNGAGGGTSDNGVLDGGETGVDGVTVELYRSGQTPGADTPIATTTTVNGRYLFTGLTPGDYVVHIPAENFDDSTDALYRAYSTTGVNADDTTNEVNAGSVNSDNGADQTNPAASGITAPVVTLTIGGEPTDDQPAGAPVDNNPNSNLTVDFGFLQYDYGDAPDTYGTTNGANGARHPLDGTTFLGSGVDAETNGFPGINADGDDTDQTPDDEDGVQFVTPIVPGQPFDLSVTTSAPGFLNIWLDFNGNGVFDAGEQAATNTAIGAGANQTVTLTAPASAAPFDEQLYARVRFTRDSWTGATPDGAAPSPGEVEDYVLMSLGDIVWVDNGAGTGLADDGIMNGSEFGVNGVTVELYRDVNGDNQPQPGGADGAAIATTTTANIGGTDGRYLFTGLEPGNYFVRIPSTEFQTGGDLFQYFSTTDQTTGGHDPDDNLNEDAASFSENGVDNADPAANGINSIPITLAYNSEPTNDGDSSTYSNLTLDFGVLRYDYGDLPDTGTGTGVGDYQTELANGGAQHIIDTDAAGNGTYLGAGVDSEIDGQPTTGADGDDTNGATPDDEDGVRFLTPIMPGQPFNVEITASRNGFLNAWIDFDGDGDLEIGEQLGSSDFPISSGTHTYTFTAPASAVPFADALYSRFRFTRNTGKATTPNGLAHNGEVEDYTLMSLGDLIWRDNGAGGGAADNGILDGGETGIPGVVVELCDGSGNPILVNGSPVRTTTDANGRYLFTGLTPGDYVVHVLKTNFDNVGDSLYGSFSSSGGPDPDNNADENADENGVDDAAPQTNGISSLPITLTAGGEPDGNGYSNRTLDFGFVSYDLGDLPDTGAGTGAGNYQTLLNDNGARHAIDVDSATGQGTFLGAGVDTETDGQPNIPATGDDTQPGGQADDEDGIVFLEPIMPGQPFNVQITAQTASGADGYLNAWIDFNGDGILGAGEQVASDQTITSGTATYTFNAPASATPFADTLYSRFRFTRNSGEVSAPTGTASNGEVEDYVLMSLGNLVWRDNGAGAGGVANDGVKQAGESGVPDVTVELYLSSQTPGVDTPIATTTTDANGNYLFTGLTPGDYKVHIPSDEFGAAGDLYQYFSTTDQSGFDNPNNNRDEDQDENGIGDETDTPVADGVTSGIVSLDYGTEPQGNGFANQTVDFGFLQYDFGDVPDTYGTTLTANGARHGIDPDVYLGAHIDAETDGQPDNEADADDDNPVAGPDDEDGVVFVTPILPHEVFRIEVTASQAGYLNGWIDYNGNGIFDAGERMWSDQPLSAGLNTLSLTSGSFDPTAASSIYARFRFTEGPNQATSPTGAANNGEVEDYALVSLGNLVWLDNGAGGGVGNDGIRQPGEQGIDGVQVELYLAGDDPLTTAPLASLTTTNGGQYMFTGLTPNRDYKVHIPPSQFVSGGPLSEYFSTTDQAGFDTPDNNRNEDEDENGIDPTTPIDAETAGITSGSIRLELGSEPPSGGTNDGDVDPNSNLTLDFGFLQYDFGDAPDSYGTTLNATGARHLLDGETYLGSRVDSEWDGQPTDTALGDDTTDTPDDEDGIVFLTPILPGQPFEVQVTASTTSFLNAWVDWNGNGTFDAGEELCTNQTVGAAPTTLTFTAPAAPDPFPGTLYSRFRLTRDSWATPSPTGEAPSPGEVEDYALGSLGSRLWRDNGAGGGGNNNGRQDGTEAGLPGATVELYRQGQTPGVDTPIATTTTDANGDYRFTGLTDDTYFVYMPPSNFITGGALENLYSSSDPLSGANNPNTGQPGYGVDQNQDENGVDDDYPYTNGIRSLPIDLELGTEPTGEDGDANSDLTLDFGFIRLDFGDLPDGPYPTSMAHNGPRHIIDDVTFLGLGVDAESDGHPGASALGDDTAFTDDGDGVVFLDPIMPGQDFRIEVMASVNGYLNAWIDWNGNGFSDGDEQIYLDEPLAAGINSLTVTAPASATPFASTIYSRFRFTNGQNEATTPEGEASNGEVEDYALLSLGDFVWRDEGQGGGVAGDGKRNGDEPPVPGVRMELYRAGQTPGSSTPIATTLTDSEGRYRFTGLTPGDYIVHIPGSEFSGSGPLADLVSSFGDGEPNADQDEGTDENGIDDDNPAANGISSGIVTLAYGTEPTAEDGDPNSNLTIDFGFHGLVSLGNRVWFDPDNNGMHDANETGIAGVELRLYGLNGRLILNYYQQPMITTTDANGYYLFDNLVPGYYIVVIQASNFAEDGPLSGFKNSDPTQKNPNFNHDMADHGLVTGNFDIGSSAKLEGTLSSEDLTPIDGMLRSLEQGAFLFDQSIPGGFEVPGFTPAP